MVDRRLSSMVDEVLESLRGPCPSASREQDFRVHLRNELEPRARDQVRAALLLDAIARQESIVVEDAALDEEIERVVESVPPAARERVGALRHESAYRESLRSQMLRDRPSSSCSVGPSTRSNPPPAVERCRWEVNPARHPYRPPRCDHESCAHRDRADWRGERAFDIFSGC